MRIYLKTTPNTDPVIFDHLPMIVGTIHKWLGKNIEHGTMSLYSFSFLKGGKNEKNYLQFPQGTIWFISALDINMLKKIIDGIRKDPEIAFGLRVKEIIIKETPLFNNQEIFWIASPVFIKRTINNEEKHYLFNDPVSTELLTETLKHKMEIAGLNDDTLKVSFDLSYKGAKTKLITYNEIKNKASWCPVIIKGKQESKGFAWDVGVGNSTGIGFGALI